jgi:hypothetical protein
MSESILLRGAKCRVISYVNLTVACDIPLRPQRTSHALTSERVQAPDLLLSTFKQMCKGRYNPSLTQYVAIRNIRGPR